MEIYLVTRENWINNEIKTVYKIYENKQKPLKQTHRSISVPKSIEHRSTRYLCLFIKIHVNNLIQKLPKMCNIMWENYTDSLNWNTVSTPVKINWNKSHKITHQCSQCSRSLIRNQIKAHLLFFNETIRNQTVRHKFDNVHQNLLIENKGNEFNWKNRQQFINIFIQVFRVQNRRQRIQFIWKK